MRFAPSTGEKSVIGNDLKIVGQGLKIISRGILQVDGKIEGDVMAVKVVVGEKGKVTRMVAGQQTIADVVAFNKANAGKALRFGQDSVLT